MRYQDLIQHLDRRDWPDLHVQQLGLAYLMAVGSTLDGSHVFRLHAFIKHREVSEDSEYIETQTEVLALYQAQKKAYQAMGAEWPVGFKVSVWDAKTKAEDVDIFPLPPYVPN